MKKFIVSLALLGLMSRLRARRSKGAAITVGMTTATAATGIIGGADVAAITAGTIAAGTTGAATKDTDAMLAGMTVARWTDATSAASCARSAPSGAKPTGAPTVAAAGDGSPQGRKKAALGGRRSMFPSAA